jgi:tagatose 6-phosphate kinase
MILTVGTTPALQRTMVFEQLRVDAVNRALDVREYASGKSINVARVIHTLGAPCVATGLLGGDSGNFCRLDMDRAGIGHDFVTVLPKTRTCITLIDRIAGSATELIEEAGPVTAGDAQKLLDKLARLLQHAKVMVLSGTLAPGCGEDFYARAIRLANAATVPVILDAKGAPLTLALEHGPFIVKPNRAELAATLNRPIETTADIREGIAAIVARGARWVIVTDGAAQTILGDGKTFWRLQTPRVKAISPIGSGDALAAGLAMGIAKGMSLPDACVLGVACGTANATTDLAGHVESEAVEALRAKIVMEQIV